MIFSTIFNPILLMNCQIHTTSLTLWLKAIYLTFVIQVKTIFYFMLFYNTTALLKKK